MDFIDYCHQNKILLAIFPPHSTHTLQPLDVVLFKPLLSAYSSELARHQQRSQGLLPVVKADFYGFFKSAYASSFTKSNVQSAFKATGIWPMDRSVVTRKFRYTTPPDQTNKMSPSNLSPADWRRVKRLIQGSVKDVTDQVVRRLEGAIHRASTYTKLLELENEGLLASLDTQNKRTRNGRRLPLKGGQKQPTAGVFFDAKEVQEAREMRRRKDDDIIAEANRKKDQKKLNKQKKLQKDTRAAEARAERDRKKRVKEAEQAAKAAEKQAEKERKDRDKAIQTAQIGKRKASRPQLKQNKRQKRVGGGAGGGAASRVATAATPEQPPKKSRDGREIITPAKYK